MKYLLIAALLYSINTIAKDKAPIGEYACNFPDDTQIGVDIVRAFFIVNKDGTGCFSFYGNDYSQDKDKISCGKFIKDFTKNFIFSAKFDGYFDFTTKSHTSIPQANKSRFVQLELQTDKPRIFIWSDYKHQSDIEYICKNTQ